MAPGEWASASELRYLDPCLAQSSGQYSRFKRDLRSRGLLVFGRWCVEEVFFCQEEKQQGLSHPGCSSRQHQIFAPAACRVGNYGRVESNRVAVPTLRHPGEVFADGQALNTDEPMFCFCPCFSFKRLSKRPSAMCCSESCCCGTVDVPWYSVSIGIRRKHDTTSTSTT